MNSVQRNFEDQKTKLTKDLAHVEKQLEKFRNPMKDSKTYAAMEMVFSAREGNKHLDKTAKELYKERFPDKPVNVGWHFYDGFSIPEFGILRVHHQYGGGDIKYSDHFDITIEQ